MDGRHGIPSLTHIPNYVQCKVCSPCGSILGDQGGGHINVPILYMIAEVISSFRPNLFFQISKEIAMANWNILQVFEMKCSPHIY